MAAHRLGWRTLVVVARFAACAIFCCAPQPESEAAWSTVVDNGPSVNRVDIVFVGDGYTQSDLDAGLYADHVAQYVDYMFAASGYLADPFPRYRNFFNVHQIDIVSQESGADHPSQSVFRDTALDATYEAFGIDRLLTINSFKANSHVNENLVGTGITADIRLATVNDPTYGGSGGSWAVYAGPNSRARDIALHELSHSFSKTADEYATQTGTFPGGEPSAVNATIDSAGTKWSHWLGFADPRADFLNIGVYEGAADYPLGAYRPSLDSKMRTLDRPFNAVVREKSILDIYLRVDPLDDWLSNEATITGEALWVDTIDPEVIFVDWYVDDELVVANYGEQFDLADFSFPAGSYAVRAHAYDEVVNRAGDGTLLDLVRRDFDQLQQEILWTVEFSGAAAIEGDYDGNGVVDAGDYDRWKATFGSIDELEADGNSDGIVDAADYSIWRDSFAMQNSGQGLPNSGVPEPPCAATFSVILVAVVAVRTRPAARRGVSSATRCI